MAGRARVLPAPLRARSSSGFLTELGAWTGLWGRTGPRAKSGPRGAQGPHPCPGCPGPVSRETPHRPAGQAREESPVKAGPREHTDLPAHSGPTAALSGIAAEVQPHLTYSRSQGLEAAAELLAKLPAGPRGAGVESGNLESP